jgi:hypothetical protein
VLLFLGLRLEFDRGGSARLCRRWRRWRRGSGFSARLLSSYSGELLLFCCCLIFAHQDVSLLRHTALSDLIDCLTTLSGGNGASKSPSSESNAGHVCLLQFAIANGAIHLELLVQYWICAGGSTRDWRATLGGWRR